MEEIKIRDEQLADLDKGTLSCTRTLSVLFDTPHNNTQHDDASILLPDLGVLFEGLEDSGRKVRFGPESKVFVGCFVAAISFYGLPALQEVCPAMMRKRHFNAKPLHSAL